MMTNFWYFLTTTFFYLPWLVIALAAGVAFGKHGKSPATAVQTLGALGMFIMALLQWLTSWLFVVSSAPAEVRYAFGIIFQFLIFLSLAIFAIGYCWEKLASWRIKPTPAVPVQ